MFSDDLLSSNNTNIPVSENMEVIVTMSIYKRKPWKLIKSLLIAPLPPVAVGLILLWALQYFPYTWMFILCIALPAVIFLALIYKAIWGENIRFEITENGQCNYYKNNKLKQSFDLVTSDLGYHHVRDANGGTERLSLRITDNTGKVHIIDGEPIGEKQFEKMFKQMQDYSKVEPEVL